MEGDLTLKGYIGRFADGSKLILPDERNLHILTHQDITIELLNYVASQLYIDKYADKTTHMIDLAEHNLGGYSYLAQTEPITLSTMTNFAVREGRTKPSRVGFGEPTYTTFLRLVIKHSGRNSYDLVTAFWADPNFNSTKYRKSVDGKKNKVIWFWCNHQIIWRPGDSNIFYSTWDEINRVSPSLECNW